MKDTTNNPLPSLPKQKESFGDFGKRVISEKYDKQLTQQELINDAFNHGKEVMIEQIISRLFWQRRSETIKQLELSQDISVEQAFNIFKTKLSTAFNVNTVEELKRAVELDPETINRLFTC